MKLSLSLELSEGSNIGLLSKLLCLREQGGPWRRNGMVNSWSVEQSAHTWHLMVYLFRWGAGRVMLEFSWGYVHICIHSIYPLWACLIRNTLRISKTEQRNEVNLWCWKQWHQLIHCRLAPNPLHVVGTAVYLWGAMKQGTRKGGAPKVIVTQSCCISGHFSSSVYSRSHGFICDTLLQSWLGTCHASYCTLKEAKASGHEDHQGPLASHTGNTLTKGSSECFGNL